MPNRSILAAGGALPVAGHPTRRGILFKTAAITLGVSGKAIAQGVEISTPGGTSQAVSDAHLRLLRDSMLALAARLDAARALMEAQLDAFKGAYEAPFRIAAFNAAGVSYDEAVETFNAIADEADTLWERMVAIRASSLAGVAALAEAFRAHRGNLAGDDDSDSDPALLQAAALIDRLTELGAGAAS